MDDRGKRVVEIVNKWAIVNKGFGYVVAPPGSGKTRLGVIASYLIKKNKPDAKVLVITPSQDVLGHWIAEDPKRYITNFMTITELINSDSAIEVDLLILDETHKYQSASRFEKIESIKTKYRLDLYGVAPEKKPKLPLVDEISFTEAYINNWILDVKEVNVEIPMTTGEIYRYTTLCNHIERVNNDNFLLWKRISNKHPEYDSVFTLLQGCAQNITVEIKSGDDYVKRIINQQDTIELIQKEMNFDLTYIVKNNNSPIDEVHKLYNSDALKALGNSYMNNLRIRSELLVNMENKKEFTHMLIKHMPDFRKLVYCESIQACDNLYNSLMDSTDISIEDKSKIGVIHSKIKSVPETDDLGNVVTFKTGKVKMISPERQKKYLIEALNNGTITTILVVNSLNEGTDVPNLSLIVNLGGSRDKVKYIQRRGRAARLGDEEGKEPIMINLVASDIIMGNKEYPNYDKIKINRRQGSDLKVMKIASNQLNLVLQLCKKKTH